MAEDSQSSDSDDYGAFLASTPKKEPGKNDKHHSTKYRAVWEQDYPWIRPYSKNRGYAMCNVCESVFNIRHGGVHDIKRHHETAKHKKRITATADGKQLPVNDKIRQNDDCSFSDNSLDKSSASKKKQRKNAKMFKPGGPRKQYFLTYDKNWEQQHPWIKANVDSAYAECRICDSVFAIDYRGIHDVVRHMDRVKHKNALLQKGMSYANFESNSNTISMNDNNTEPSTAMPVPPRKRIRKRIKLENQADNSVEESNSALYWDTFMNDSNIKENAFHSDSSDHSVNPFESIELTNEIELDSQTYQFDASWIHQFAWLEQCPEDCTYAGCLVCNTSFSIACNGVAELSKHENGARHKLKSRRYELKKLSNVTKIKTESKPSAETSTNPSESLLIFAYHKIRHNISISTACCIATLLETMAQDSRESLQNMLKHEHVKNVVKNVLAPATQQTVAKDLTNNHPFAICTDLSYRDHLGTFPLIIRYFNRSTGVQNKLLTFLTLSSSDSPHVLFDAIASELKGAGLSVTNCSAFVANNSELNYGPTKSVYVELKKINSDILSMKCVGFDVQTTARKAQHEMQFDMEIVIYKCFNELCGYNAGVPDELHELYKWSRQEWPHVLSKVPMNYCSLVEAANQILSHFSALKSFFCNAQFAPKMLVEFFRFEMAGCYLGLFKHLLSTFHSTYVRLMSSELSSAIDLYDIMIELRNALIARRNDDNYESITRHLLPQLTDTKSIDKFRKDASVCFEKAIEQLNGCFDFDQANVKYLSPLRLQQRQPSFEDWQQIVRAFHIPGIVEQALAEESTTLSSYYQANRMFSVENTMEAAIKWWMELFKVHTMPNVDRICSYAFSLPVANVASPRICLDLKNASKVDSNQLTYQKAEIIVRQNLAAHLSCQDFIGYLNTTSGKELISKCSKSVTTLLAI